MYSAVIQKVLGNSVPAAAGIQRVRALFMMTGRKGCVGGFYIKGLIKMIA